MTKRQCPCILPERVTPRSPTIVSKPSGNASTNPRALAAAAAARTCEKDGAGPRPLPYAMLSAMVPPKMTAAEDPCGSAQPSAKGLSAGVWTAPLHQHIMMRRPDVSTTCQHDVAARRVSTAAAAQRGSTTCQHNLAARHGSTTRAARRSGKAAAARRRQQHLVPGRPPRSVLEARQGKACPPSCRRR